MTDNPHPRVGASPRGRLFVVSGPSGVGKGTILNAVISSETRLCRSVSATTRLPRANEVDGIDYHFLTRVRFEADVAAGGFYEHAEYGGNLYGTPREWVDQTLASGSDVVLEIEVQGAEQVRKSADGVTMIFIKPPSMEVLEERLRLRGSESDDRIHKRLEIARRELARVEVYDYMVVNDDLKVAISVLRAIVAAEPRPHCRLAEPEVAAYLENR